MARKAAKELLKKKLKDKLYNKERRLEADSGYISPKLMQKIPKRLKKIKKELRDLDKDNPTKMKNGGIIGGGRQARQYRQR